MTMRLPFWSALIVAATLAANAQAATIAYGIGATAVQNSAQTFAFTFGSPYAGGPFDFGENDISALLTDTGGDGASLTATLVEGRIDGASVALDLSFDCVVAAGGGSATCIDHASGPISAPATGIMEVFVQFTLSAFDSVSIVGAFEISQATPVPEPGTLALFGAALAGLGFMRRERRTG
jgi:hypothetical protein